MFREVQQNKVSLDIISQIRDAILSGTLNPGDRLPPEKELVCDFGVSKHTLREAMRALEVMGFIEVRKGACGGAVVLEVDLKTARESISNFLYFQNVSIRDLSEVRKVFEPHLARLAAERMTPKDLDDLAATQACCLESMARGDSTYEHEIEFHRIIAKASGNPVFMLIQDFVNSGLAESKNRLRPGNDFQERLFTAHQRILEALRSREPELTASRMQEHVCEVEHSLEELQEERQESMRKTGCTDHDTSNGRNGERA
ncbi:FadR/GntR family transcriptional regulator [Desulfomonile tiedjei]|uniref:Transcriptional regulator n=1 Tax=Desulfomonile tiedjei (strain ATCC 49306 / DSM 6799 / DCB-1) TaxID=706587 RepID=I4CEG0_DESTA|nr:FadR/GntR family transcriptional regulator [Desulfomonile tiedjei]AFM27951.1 transcriptional regulator [Desulfomonile tiedjei DSM 6799]